MFETTRAYRALNEAGNCTIDAIEQWPSMTVYFFHRRFVGYSTLSPTGMLVAEPNVATAKGLRIDDSLAQARLIYGDELRTSLAQGGSWFAKTPQGTLDGYLTAEVNQKSPAPRILSIEAGAVGCPAASP